MSISVVALAASSGLLELGGLWLTVCDIRDFAARVHGYKARGYTLYLRAAGRVRVGGSAEISGSRPTLEQRVDALEAMADHLTAQITKAEDDLRAEFNQSLSDMLADHEKEALERLYALRDLVIGPPRRWIRVFAGPLLIAAGIICGVAAAVVGVVR
jgi:hypothetical protein